MGSVDTSGVRPGVRPDVRPDVRAARVSSAAPKKKSFDRGGPVWPPRSNVTNDRLRGGSGGALPPQPKTGGSGGQRPPAKNILTWRTLFTKTIDANKWHAANYRSLREHTCNFKKELLAAGHETQKSRKFKMKLNLPGSGNVGPPFSQTSETR